MKNLLNRYILVIVMMLCITVKAQETYSDFFSSVSYSNNNGTQNWSGNWAESNDDNDPSNGRIRITGNELRFSRIGSHYITRAADLSSYSTATLSFDWQTSSLETNETLVIQISSNGSSFSTIGTFSGNQSGSFSQDITGYLSGSTTIRFRKGSNDWDQGNDRVYIDNVTITAYIVDQDGDGISDMVDLDDDNDGITDEEEYCTTINASFLTSADVGQRSVVVNHTDTGYLRLDFSSMDNSFQLDINGTTVHPSVLEFESGALDAGDEYFVFQSDGAFINSPWVANSNGLPRLRLIINESGQATLYGTRYTSSTALEVMEAQASTPFNTITWTPGNNNTFTITNQAGPGPEGFTGELFASSVCDTDGDGISNHLDLDSDNDGIMDIVESGVLDISGVSDSNNDGRIDGAISGSGSNGLYNSIEDNDTVYAILSYSILDSDSDGSYDAYVLDADGDGCNGVLEAGFTDNNDDGVLGPSSVTIDSDGLVTSGVDGYTVPADNDSNSIYDYREVGTVPTITSQPVDTTTCPGCTTAITVTSIADQYQWQFNNVGVWNDLTDSGIYSGATSQTLTIINPTPSENNTQYRVVLSNDTFVCGSTISSTATLTLQVTTVVTNRTITYRVNKN
ncbi:immunoglobulin domain-containing protein [Allomuricauda sp. M10]|uniref:immunoglobulin domain-containing protein n=1 Tax=Allomuricauda sp. M10 TaxID=2683292 RepID=UPI001D18EF65|nr:immunoglobulin domain-containing protein [Muricauda sp. M10]